MMRPLLGVLSPGGASARLSVLIFHRVLAQPDPLFPEEPDASRFDAVCGWLRRWFQVLPLPDAQRMLLEGRLPARALSITFDDGYADNHEVALPVLRRHGLSATFFVATGFLDGGRMWNDTLIEALRRTPLQALDLGAAGLEGAAEAALAGLGRLPLAGIAERRGAIDRVLRGAKYLPLPDREQAMRALARAARAELPNDLMMRSDQVAALHRAGMAIGGHTVNHPILAGMGDDEVRREIEGGKARLEAITQAPVTLFAYPNGRPGQDFDDRSAALARQAGFEAAVTTAWGAADRSTDRYRLPRFTPWDRARWRFGLRMARNLCTRAAA